MNECASVFLVHLRNPHRVCRRSQVGEREASSSMTKRRIRHPRKPSGTKAGRANELDVQWASRNPRRVAVQ